MQWQKQRRFSEFPAMVQFGSGRGENISFCGIVCLFVSAEPTRNAAVLLPTSESWDQVLSLYSKLDKCGSAAQNYQRYTAKWTERLTKVVFFTIDIDFGFETQFQSPS